MSVARLLEHFLKKKKVWSSSVSYCGALWCSVIRIIKLLKKKFLQHHTLILIRLFCCFYWQSFKCKYIVYLGVHYIHILHWDLFIIFCVQISLKNSLNFYTGVQYKSSQFTIFGAGELKIFGELIGNKIIKNHQYWRLQIQRNTVSIFFLFPGKKRLFGWAGSGHSSRDFCTWADTSFVYVFPKGS